MWSTARIFSTRGDPHLGQALSRPKGKRNHRGWVSMREQALQLKIALNKNLWWSFRRTRASAPPQCRQIRILILYIEHCECVATRGKMESALSPKVNNNARPDQRAWRATAQFKKYRRRDPAQQLHGNHRVERVGQVVAGV